MTRLLWLADVARTVGLRVVEVDGWQTRGAATMTALPAVVVGHHTATRAAAMGDLPTLPILRDGRPDLPGPLCQYGLGRVGTVYVVAAGKANHAGRGEWRGVTVSTNTIGIEAEHPGDSTPWPDVQLDAYDRLVAAVLQHTGRDYRWFCGHREWALPAGRKPDPTGIDLDGMRRRVHLLMTSEEDPLSALTEEQKTLLLTAAVELTQRRPNLIAHPETGVRGEQTLFETALFAQLDAYTAMQETRALRAEVSALHAAVQALGGGA